MRKYETLMIARPGLEEEEVKGLVDEYTAMVARRGGRVTNIDIWGLRRLEYPIDHEESGHYAVVNFESETEPVKELERTFAIKDEVLRAKTLLIEKD